MSFNPAILTSAALAFQTNVDAVTIQRRVPSGTPPGFTLTTIFSGDADFQEGGGSTYVTPAGSVEQVDAKLFIDLRAANPLPVVEVGDTLTNAADGKTFAVVAVAKMTFGDPYLEIALKRGPLKYSTK